MRSGDKTHFIVGFENIDEEVKKEQEHIEALNRANELARRDGLTETRNVIAFREFEASIKKSMDSVVYEYKDNQNILTISKRK